MIYIVLFIYYVCLALLYDVGKYRKHRQLHFFVTLILMILVSGLRYRVGGDTTVYMDDFKDYPTLFNLSWNTFFINRYDPLWILLNVCCKTLYSDFFLVQCVVSTIHIGIWGNFVKKICPSLCFSMILFYYMFQYISLNMELMREALALSFFLFSLLSLNEHKFWKTVLCVLISFMFHKFSLVVFVSFYCFLRLYSFKKHICFLLLIFFIVMPVIQRDWIYDVIGNILRLDAVYTKEVISYATSDKYTLMDYNWKGVIGIFLLISIYIFMNIKCGKIYSSYVCMKKNVIESAIYFSCILISLKYSFRIVYRLYDYFQSFTSLLIIVFVMTLISCYSIKKRILLYIICLLIPVFFTIRKYQGSFDLNPDAALYLRYYPYSSVFNPKLDRERELRIYNYYYHK